MRNDVTGKGSECDAHKPISFMVTNDVYRQINRHIFKLTNKHIFIAWANSSIWEYMGQTKDNGTYLNAIQFPWRFIVDSCFCFYAQMYRLNHEKWPPKRADRRADVIQIYIRSNNNIEQEMDVIQYIKTHMMVFTFHLHHHCSVLISHINITHTLCTAWLYVWSTNRSFATPYTQKSRKI